MGELLTIDGSRGEGGGQILRTSLALAACTGTEIRLANIRASRPRRGLAAQHLTAARAAAEICGGELSGDELGSIELTFRPGRPRGGSYHFVVPSAGSACLVFQTVLWPLLAADEPSSVTFEGGTHNPMAPPFDFLAQSFVPLLERMGASVLLRLESYGFYPHGGGRFVARIEPCERLAPLELLDAGPVVERRARALLARLPGHIATRELGVVRDRLGWHEDECLLRRIKTSGGPGNAVLLQIERQHLTETFTGFGVRGQRAEAVARGAVDQVERYLAAAVPVGPYLADQLVIPLGLAGGGAFATLPLSAHAETNIEVVAEILGRRFAVSSFPPHGVLVSLGAGPGTGARPSRPPPPPSAP
ncbi:MAG: RNA 3'-terminal phosphate cyclase [Deltaproteobacteria bacterium]|nr:RNA 3'-terminal phosphate cyclase [Deltaproteobacteria bacterium]